MRIYRFFGTALIVVSCWLLGSCANNQQNATSANTNAKSYGSSDLEKTGKRTSGEALQAADPAVTARGGN